MFAGPSLSGHFGDFIHGFFVTVQISFEGFAIALVIGIVLAVFRVSPLLPLRGFGTAYVEVLRNTPLLVLLLLIFFGLPEVGVQFGLMSSAIIGLGVYEAAFVCEVVRSGINTVPVGQAEAARALGLSNTRVLSTVVMPQALRSVVQPLGTLCISTVLNSSLAAAIGNTDITGTANHVFSDVVAPIPIYVGSGIAYLVLNLAIGKAAGLIERRVAILR